MAEALLPRDLAARRRLLTGAGEICGLLGVLLTALAIALWPSDASLDTAFSHKVDIPYEVSDYLASAGVSYRSSSVAEIVGQRAPTRAYAVLSLLLTVTAAGAALRERWAMYFSAQALLLFYPLLFGFNLAVAASFSTMLSFIGIARALIARDFRLARLIFVLMLAAGFVGKMTHVWRSGTGPHTNKVASYYAPAETKNREKSTLLREQVSAPPAAASPASAYVRAQIAYMSNDPAGVAAEMDVVAEGNFTHGFFTAKRRKILGEFVEARTGALKENVLMKGLSAASGVLSGALILLSSLLAFLAAAMGRRAPRLEKLRTKLAMLSTARA